MKLTPLVAFAAAVGLGCASCPPARYEGISFGPRVAASEVEVLDYVPHHHEVLGDVTVECKLPEESDNGGDLAGALAREEQRRDAFESMKTRAAAAGGTVLVGADCKDDDRRRVRRCSARVAAPAARETWEPTKRTSARSGSERSGGGGE